MQDNIAGTDIKPRSPNLTKDKIKLMTVVKSELSWRETYNPKNDDDYKGGNLYLISRV